MPNKDSLFSMIPNNLPEELFTTIIEKEGVKIERIVSDGHRSDPDFWYDQDMNEFVLIVQGSGTIQFQGQREPLTLSVGEYVFIPSHTKHRVVSTEMNAKTIWLAIHF